MPTVTAPGINQPEADDYLESFRLMGLSPEQVKKQMLKLGYSGLQAQSKPIVPFAGMHEDDINAEIDTASISNQLDPQGQPVNPSDAKEAAKGGASGVAKAIEARRDFARQFNDSIKGSLTTTIGITGNLLEIAGAMFIKGFDIPRQVLARKLSKDFSNTKLAKQLFEREGTGEEFIPTPKITWAEALAQTLPEFYGRFTYPTDQVTGEQKQPEDRTGFLAAVGQLGDILKTAGGILRNPLEFERYKAFGRELKEEPMVFERGDEWYPSELAFRDAFGQNKWDSFMKESPLAVRAGMHVVSAVTDVFSDPSLGLYLGANKLTRGIKSVSDARKVMKKEQFGWETIKSAQDIKDVRSLVKIHQAEEAARRSVKGVKELHYAERLAGNAVEAAKGLSRVDKARAAAALARVSRVRDAMKRSPYTIIKERSLPRKMPIRNPDAPIDNAKVYQQLRGAALTGETAMKYEEGLHLTDMPMVDKAVRDINVTLGARRIPREEFFTARRAPDAPPLELFQKPISAFRDNPVLTPAEIAASLAKSKVIPGAKGLRVSNIAKGHILEYRSPIGNPIGRAVVDNGVLTEFVLDQGQKGLSAAAKSALVRKAYSLGARDIAPDVSKGGARAFHAHAVKKAAIEGKPIPDPTFESFKRALGGAAPDVQADVIGRVNRLTPDVYEYLRVKGANLPEHPATTTARSAPPDPTDFMDHSITNLSNRAIKGPDDMEMVGDALYYLQGGVPAHDLTIGPMLPEHKIFGSKVQARPDPGDLFILGNESKELSSRVLAQVFPEMYREGIQEGSVIGRMSERIKAPFGGFITTWETILREPTGSIPREAEILINAQHQFDLEYSSTAEHFMRVLERAGIGKRKGSSFKTLSPEKSEELVELMDLKASLIADNVPVEAARSRFQKVYDHKPKEIQRAHDELRNWLNVTAKRLNIPAEDFVEGYVRHLVDPADFQDGYRPLAFAGLENLRMVGQHPRLDPVWGAMLRRGENPSANWKRDIAGAMDEYLRGALNEIHFKPAYAKALESAEASGDMATANRVMELTDEMKGRPAVVDRVVEGMAEAAYARWGIKVKPGSLVKNSLIVSGLFYTGLLAGRMRYVLTNLGAASINAASKSGILNTARGYFMLASKEGRQFAKANGIQGQWSKVLENARLNIRGKDIGIIEAMNKLGPDQSEFIARGVSFYAALSDITRTTGKSLAKLEDEGLLMRSLHDAVRAAEVTQHIYGALGRPIGASTLSKGVAIPGFQFLSWGYKQLGFLYRGAKEDPGMVLRYMIISGMAQRAAANTFGVDVQDVVGLGFVQGMSKGVLPESPASQTLVSLLQLNQSIEDNVLGTRRDLDDLQQKVQRVIDSSKALIPILGSLGLSEAVSTAERALTGEEFNKMTGEFVGGIPAEEQIGSLVTGLPGRQLQRRRQAAREIQERVNFNIFRKQSLVEESIDKFTEAIESGTVPRETIDALKLKLEEEGLPVSGVSDMIKSRLDLYSYSELLRTILDNKFIINQIGVETLKDFNIIDLLNKDARNKAEVRRSIQERKR